MVKKSPSEKALKIKDLAAQEPDILDDGPIEQPSKSKNDGLNIIEGIYDFFTLRKPIGFCVMERYKNKLSLKIEHPNIYTSFLLLFMVLDWVYALTVYVLLMVMTILIVLSFARGVGILDWLTKVAS